MNILLVISDSLRADYLGCYGSDWVRTPHIDVLSRRSVSFRRCYSASFPTGPMRRDLHSGRFTFLYTSWREEWDPDHPVLAEIMSEAGFRTAMITDTPSNGACRRGFDHFHLIEGQAGAGVVTGGGEPDLPADPRKLRVPMERLSRILKVESSWSGEEDRFVAQTMRAASRWLESRHGEEDPFFLCVDTFDPHEPWNPPRFYIDRYDPGYSGDELFEPAYEPAGYASQAEIDHMRCMYAGEVSLVDRWVGHLLETLRQSGLDGETCVILTSDHGFYHGEHGLIGKVQLDREGRIVRRWPLYDTISHVPLLVKVPGVAARTSDIFCQPPDIMPTVLGICGIEVPEKVQGRPLLSPPDREVSDDRSWALSSYTYCQDDSVRPPTSLRTKDYLYVYGGDEWPSEYYDVKEDPAEGRNLIREREEEAEDAHRILVSLLKRLDCPKKSLDLRSDFEPAKRTDLPLQRIL